MGNLQLPTAEKAAHDLREPPGARYKHTEPATPLLAEKRHKTSDFPIPKKQLQRTQTGNHLLEKQEDRQGFPELSVLPLVTIGKDAAHKSKEKGQSPESSL